MQRTDQRPILPTGFKYMNNSAILVTIACLLAACAAAPEAQVPKPIGEPAIEVKIENAYVFKLAAAEQGRPILTVIDEVGRRTGVSIRHLKEHAGGWHLVEILGADDALIARIRADASVADIHRLSIQTIQ